MLLGMSMSRKLDSIFPRGTIRQPSGSHIGREVALVARTAAFVYIYARIPQTVEMTLSFHATNRVGREGSRKKDSPLPHIAETTRRSSLCHVISSSFPFPPPGVTKQIGAPAPLR